MAHSATGNVLSPPIFRTKARWLDALPPHLICSLQSHIEHSTCTCGQQVLLLDHTTYVSTSTLANATGTRKLPTSALPLRPSAYTYLTPSAGHALTAVALHVISQPAVKRIRTIECAAAPATASMPAACQQGSCQVGCIPTNSQTSPVRFSLGMAPDPILGRGRKPSQSPSLCLPVSKADLRWCRAYGSLY